MNRPCDMRFPGHEEDGFRTDIEAHLARVSEWATIVVPDDSFVRGAFAATALNPGNSHADELPALWLHYGN
jgi:hypothetical protein